MISTPPPPLPHTYLYYSHNMGVVPLTNLKKKSTYGRDHLSTRQTEMSPRIQDQHSYYPSKYKQVLITYKTRAHAQLFVTLLPQAVSQTFRHI